MKNKKPRRIPRRKKQESPPPDLPPQTESNSETGQPADSRPDVSSEEAQIALFAEPLETMLKRLGWQSTHDIDLLLVGDGSGSWWNIEGGWAVVLVDMKTGRRKLLSGSFSEAAIADLEIFPYLIALLWYEDLGRNREGARSRNPTRALVVTDNQNIVKQANGQHAHGRMGPWWAAFADAQRRMNYSMRWQFIDRDTVGLNAFCDLVSRDNRLRHRDLFVDRRDMVYAFNPDQRMRDRSASQQEKPTDAFD